LWPLKDVLYSMNVIQMSYIVSTLICLCFLVLCICTEYCVLRLLWSNTVFHLLYRSEVWDFSLRFPPLAFYGFLLCHFNVLLRIETFENYWNYWFKGVLLWFFHVHLSLVCNVAVWARKSSAKLQLFSDADWAASNGRYGRLCKFNWMWCFDFMENKETANCRTVVTTVEKSWYMSVLANFTKECLWKLLKCPNCPIQVLWNRAKMFICIKCSWVLVTVRDTCFSWMWC